MSSQLISLFTLMLVLLGAGVWLWQRAGWQERRKAAASSIDELMALEQGLSLPIGDERGASEQRKKLMGGSVAAWLNLILLRAGWSAQPRTLVFLCLPTLLLAMAGMLLQGVLLASVLGSFGAVLAVAVLKWRMGRQRAQMTSAIPAYLDGVVRLMTVGHSVQSAFHNSPTTPGTPLAHAIAHAMRLQSGGLEPDQAMQQVGDLYDSAELLLLASILRMGMRFGGRADLILARVAVFIRDREQAQQELMAQSSETRLSAWVLGLLPVGIALYIVAMNPKFIGGMWADPVGQNLLITALVLQLAGAAVLYRLTKSLED